MSSNEYANQYTDEGYWDKVKGYAKSAGEAVLTPSLKLYYSLGDADTPAWAKAVIVGALGYFVSPIDAIPDMIPVVGFSDDLGVLVAAVATVAAHIKEEHSQRAATTVTQWLS